MSTIVFFHAHPDDEAIFTGGTIARMVGGGHRAVVVIATSGELGADDGSAALGPRRVAETRAACERLGVSDVVFLGYSDSGLAPSARGRPAGAFRDAAVGDAAARLADVVRRVGASSLVAYDDGGIYGHPDHVAVHEVGIEAARIAEIPTVYEATVDREYLHFVETHLVGHALAALADPAPVGVPTVLVTTTVDVRPVIEAKRRAIAAHVSQISADADVLTMDDATFAAVYGFEWFIRRGPRGPLDEIAM